MTIIGEQAICYTSFVGCLDLVMCLHRFICCCGYLVWQSQTHCASDGAGDLRKLHSCSWNAIKVTVLSLNNFVCAKV